MVAMAVTGIDEGDVEDLPVGIVVVVQHGQLRGLAQVIGRIHAFASRLCKRPSVSCVTQTQKEKIRKNNKIILKK